ncbi:hypothetical protein [Scopulibacillus cellulosilyticus]|uniref:Uncharacterized protein n=1 Tax=Scopulibacillus cellulosilyticus TaxID=2665665 RepID=A0ABW2PZF2_9BACL
MIHYRKILELHDEGGHCRKYWSLSSKSNRGHRFGRKEGISLSVGRRNDGQMD